MRATRSRTKLFWSWVNYVWLHLHSLQRKWKDYCDFVDIDYQKLISRRVTRWLSLHRSLPRMLWLHQASNSYLMFINKAAVVLKHFFGNSLSESVHIKSFEMICGCFYWTSSEYSEVKSISCWGHSVFHHCEGKDSRGIIRYTYQAKLNQH